MLKNLKKKTNVKEIDGNKDKEYLKLKTTFNLYSQLVNVI